MWIEKWHAFNRTNLFGQATSCVRVTENFVTKDREIQHKTKSNWMCYGQLILGQLEAIFVGTLRFFNHFYKQYQCKYQLSNRIQHITLSFDISGYFSQIAIIITFHFQIEYFRFRCCRFRNEMLIKQSLNL